MKTGHWIDSNSFLMVVMGDTVMNLPAKECSICHKPHIRGYGADFCPNCGAKMQEQEYEQELEQEPKPDWIPVSERLPERSGWYLVSLKNGNVQKAWYRVAPINQGGSYWRGSIKRPIAWMPLPEPYKAGGASDDKI